MTRYLKVGDVIDIASEVEIYADIPEKFIYSNRRTSNKNIHSKITTGCIYTIGEKDTFDTGIFVGEYVVLKTAYDGGGYAHGIHDVFPDGHHVFCKKLKDGEYSIDGVEIDFYQSGCFTAMIYPEDIQVIRTMEMTK